MKNIPQKIYLQIDDEAYDNCEDFKELQQVTWSDVEINRADIEYIRKPTSKEILKEVNEATQFDNYTTTKIKMIIDKLLNKE